MITRTYGRHQLALESFARWADGARSSATAPYGPAVVGAVKGLRADLLAGRRYDARLRTDLAAIDPLYREWFDQLERAGLQAALNRATARATTAKAPLPAATTKPVQDRLPDGRRKPGWLWLAEVQAAR